MAKGRALGKGLASLLPAAQSYPAADGDGEITVLSIDRVLPNPFQPRREANENTLAELADSIRAHGIIQPIVVCRNEDGDYCIVAGERRWKAAQIVGLTELPVRVIEGDEKQIREISLIENIQREDLSPIDAALAISELIQSFDITQEELSTRIGWSRASIANKLRLLNLPEEVQILLANSELSEGHCRTLLSLESQSDIIELARNAVNDQLSVRQIEDAVKRIKNSTPETNERKPSNYHIHENLSDAAKRLGISIRVTGKKKMKLLIDGVGEELMKEFLQYIEKRGSEHFPGNTDAQE